MRTRQQIGQQIVVVGDRIRRLRGRLFGVAGTRHPSQPWQPLEALENRILLTTFGWDGSVGVPPWDPSLPLNLQYTLQTSPPATSITYGNGVLHVVDNDASLDAGILKAIGPIAANQDAVFQVELKMTSHQRSTFDWGALILMDNTAGGSIIISKTAVGFEGSNGDSFENNVSYALDTTNGFHTYRITKTSTTMSLYVDNFVTPVISEPFVWVSQANVDFYPAKTSGGGLASYDISSFAYNIGSTTLDLTQINHAPTDIAISNNTVAENQPTGATVGNLSTTDPDAGNTFTYTLVSGVGGGDNGSFTISGSTLKAAAPFNYEAKSSYSVRVRSTDQGSLTTEKVFTINVTNVNEAPSGTDKVVTTLEDTAYTLAAADFGFIDPNDSPANSLLAVKITTLPSTGALTDNAIAVTTGQVIPLADITGGKLVFTPGAGGSGVPYATFTFQVQDNGGTVNGGLDLDPTPNTLTINVTSVNHQPQLVNQTFGPTPENSPNGTVVGTVLASDPDNGQSLTYAITAGNTNNAFAINAATGQLTVASSAALNFEITPSFGLTVKATDNGAPILFGTATITVNLGNVNEAPTDLSLSPSSIAENQSAGTTIGTFGSTDPDASDSFTYSLVGGAGSTDNGSFTISGGQLRNVTPFDFEAKSSYSIRVRTIDAGGLFFEKVLTIGVTNVNEPPTDLSLSSSNIPEGQPIGTTVGTFTTTDPDAGETFTYALVSGGGGSDNSSFTITGNTLKTAAVFDFGTQSLFSVRIRATDSGGLFFEKVMTVNVTRVNKSPTDLSLSSSSVAESQPIGTAVGTFTTTDPDVGDAFTYLLVGGTGSTNNASFTIAGNTLKTAAQFDFNAKNSYSIRVRTTDSGGLPFEKVFTIGVMALNHAPTDISISTSNVAENQPAGTTVGTFATTDPDFGDAFTYALASGVGDEDNAAFTINVDHAIQTTAKLDFEARSSYSVRVRSTDAGGLFVEKVFAIFVTNVNEAPSIVPQTFILPEHSNAGELVGTVLASDPDAGDSLVFSILAGNQGNAFALDPATGVLTVNNPAALDFKTKHRFGLAVQVTDHGNLTALTTVTVNLTAVFGTLNTGKNVTLAMTDSDGTLVTFALKGGGSAVLIPGSDSGGTFYDLNITGTTSKSKLTVTTKKSKLFGDDGMVTLRNVTVGVGASLGSFAAKTGKLVGAFSTPAGITVINLAETSGDAQIQITPSAIAGPQPSVTLTATRIHDLSIDSVSPLKSLTAIEWRNDDAHDTITTPWLGALKITGSKTVGSLSSGNFGADVFLSDTTQKQTLGAVTIAGTVDGAHFISAGNVGSFTVGAMHDSVLAAGFTGAVADLPSGLPLAFSTLASITSVTVKDLPGNNNGFVNSLIYGAKLGLITLKDVQTTNDVPGLKFGFSADTLASYTRKDAAGKVVKKLLKLSDPVANADDAGSDDLVVEIV